MISRSSKFLEQNSFAQRAPIILRIDRMQRCHLCLLCLLHSIFGEHQYVVGSLLPIASLCQKQQCIKTVYIQSKKVLFKQQSQGVCSFLCACVWERKRHLVWGRMTMSMFQLFSTNISHVITIIQRERERKSLLEEASEEG